jgi:uncharacterized glyoxalase superfamily protein PhnB
MPVTMLDAEPCVFAADFTAALAFYRDRLGFVLENAYGEPPHFGVLSRDGARLTLREVRRPIFAADIRESEQLIAVSLTLARGEDVDAMHTALAAQGVRIHQPPRTEPWGARTMIVLDPDGNLILLAGPASTA